METITLIIVLILICFTLIIYGKNGKSKKDITDIALAVGVVGEVIFTLILVIILSYQFFFVYLQ